MRTILFKYSKKSMFVLLCAIIFLMMLGINSLIFSTVNAATVSFTAGETIYYDFTNISGGANFFGDRDDAQSEIQGDHWFYNGSAGGTVVTATFTAAYTGTVGTTVMAKTGTGNWADVKLKARSSGQNMLVINSAGTDYTWATYSPTTAAGTTTGSYYIRGNYYNNWGSGTQLKKSFDASYNFIKTTKGNDDYQFKILNEANNWNCSENYGSGAVQNGKNSTNITIGTSGDNACVTTGNQADNYFAIFYTSDHKICASKFLPNAKTARTITRSTPSGGSLTLNGGTSNLSIKQNSVYKVVATPDSTHKLTKLVVGSTTVYDNSTGTTSAYTYYAQAGSANATVTATYATRSTAYTITKKRQLGSNAATSNGTLSAFADMDETLSDAQYITDGTTEYKFDHWDKTTNPSNVTIGNTSNYSTTIRATGTATVTAVYTECSYIKLYTAKGSSLANDWTNMNAYLFGDGNNTWPGVSILSNSENYNHGDGARTYYYVKYYTEGTNGKNYTNVVFNNGNNAQQTVDLTIANHNGYFFDMSKESNETANDLKKLDGNWHKMENMYNVVMKYKIDGASATNGLGSSSSGCGYTEVTPQTSYNMTNNYTPIVGADSTNNATIKATANAGYSFVRWDVTGGASVASTTSATTTLTSTAAGTATAVFKRNDYTIAYKQFDVIDNATTNYNSSSSHYTLASGYPTTGQMGVSKTFTVTAKSGYRIKEVTATYGSSNALIVTAGSNGAYSFTMPAGNVTVKVTTQKTTTISFTTSGTGIQSVSATSNGTTLTSGGTVDVGATIKITPTFSTGYELNTSSSYSSGWTGTYYQFTAPNTASTTVNIEAKKIDYTVTITKKIGSVNNAAAGTVEFRKGSSTATSSLTIGTSSSSGNSTANYNQALYLYITDSNGYYLKSVKIGTTSKFSSSTQESTTHTVSLGNMPNSAQTITVEFGAIVPALTGKTITPLSPQSPQTSSSDYVYAGQSFKLTTTFNSVTKITDINYKGTTTSVNDSTSPNEFQSTVDKSHTYSRTSPYTEQTITIDFRNKYINDTSISPTQSDSTTKVKVRYTSVQLAYLELEDLYNKCKAFAEGSNALTESDCDSGYSDFITKYNAAKSAYNYQGTEIPNFDDSNDRYTTPKNELQTAYNNLVFKTNTVYVLVKSTYTSGVKIRFTNASPWLDANNTDNKISSSGSTYCYRMTKEGTANTNAYNLYSITFPGKADVSFYYTSGDNVSYASSTSSTYNATTNNKLSGEFDADSLAYGEYYYDIKTATAGSGNSTSTTLRSTFSDLGISASGNRNLIFPYDSSDASNTKYSAKDIFDELDIEYSGSLKDSSCAVTTRLTIEGPYGRGVSAAQTRMNNVLATNTTKSWIPNVDDAGKYKVTVNYFIGTDARVGEGATFVGSEEYSIYVAHDKINVYIDMNGNAGTPSFQFKYKISGDNTDYYLPFEFELDSGSEYIHSTSFKISELKKRDRSIDINNGIKFDKLLVDTDEIGNDGFTVGTDALRSGEIWLKANSTHMTDFDVISYEGANQTFVALDEDNNVISYMGTNNGTPYPRTYSIGTNSTPIMPISGVSGVGIITDDDEGTYSDYYAAYDLEYRDENRNPQRNFTYNVKATANKEFVIKNADNTNNEDRYYFDGWIRVNYSNNTYTPAPEGLITEEPVLNINENSLAGTDYYYAAKFKKINTAQRLEITYKFRDYDNSDGVMEFNESMTSGVYDHTTAASYTKVIKTTMALNTLATAAKVKELAKDNFPKIHSSYFDYTFDDNETPTEITKDSDNNKVTAEITISQEPHEYSLKVNGNTVPADSSNHHYFQQTRTLTASTYGVNSYPVWCVGTENNKVPIATGDTFDVKFTGDMVVSVESNPNVDLTTAMSDIRYRYSVVYRDGTSDATERVTHNFYIIDRPANGGTFVGGGVLYATTDGTNYRQEAAATNLATSNSRETFIRGVLNGTYDVEFKPQTIDNTGFNYVPYENHYDLYRKSDVLNGFQYFFGADAINKYSEATRAQTLRVYSFMVYSTTSGNSTSYTIVSSPYFAEVQRYKAPSNSNS